MEVAATFWMTGDRVERVLGILSHHRVLPQSQHRSRCEVLGLVGQPDQMMGLSGHIHFRWLPQSRDVLSARFCEMLAGAHVIETDNRRIPSPDEVETSCHISFITNNRISSNTSANTYVPCESEVGNRPVRQV